MRNLPRRRGRTATDREATDQAVTDHERAQALDALARALLPSLPDVGMRWDQSAARFPCLRLDVPDVGPVRIFVGKGWFWFVHPRRPLCPIAQPYRASQLIIGAVRAAAARERDARTQATRPAPIGSRAAAREENARARTRARYPRRRHGLWAVAS